MFHRVIKLWMNYLSHILFIYHTLFLFLLIEQPQTIKDLLCSAFHLIFNSRHDKVLDLVIITFQIQNNIWNNNLCQELFKDLWHHTFNAFLDWFVEFLLVSLLGLDTVLYLLHVLVQVFKLLTEGMIVIKELGWLWLIGFCGFLYHF